jgi:hypothetical protein
VFKATDWAADEANLTVYRDASGIGMGLYFIELRTSSQSALPLGPPKDIIFYFKALAVLSIVKEACSHIQIPKCLIVFSDNMNTIDIFHSLRAKPSYNVILKPMVSLLLQHNIDLCVIHVPRADNIIADALSRFQNSQALDACPGLTISALHPP